MNYKQCLINFSEEMSSKPYKQSEYCKRYLSLISGSEQGLHVYCYLGSLPGSTALGSGLGLGPNLGPPNLDGSNNMPPWPLPNGSRSPLPTENGSCVSVLKYNDNTFCICNSKPVVYVTSFLLAWIQKSFLKVLYW